MPDQPAPNLEEASKSVLQRVRQQTATETALEICLLQDQIATFLSEREAREELREAAEGWARARAAFARTGGSDHPDYKTLGTVLALAEQNLLASLPASESAQTEQPTSEAGS